VRQWLISQDRPGLFRNCIELINAAYGYTFSSPSDVPADSHDENDNIEVSVGRIPHSVLALFSSRPKKSYSQFDAGNVLVTTVIRREENSFICFYSTGEIGANWVVGRIEYIVEEQGEVKLVVRRNIRSKRSSDPFTTFWNFGFEAQLVSSSFEEEFEVVLLSRLAGHAVKWELSADEAVVLRHRKVSSNKFPTRYDLNVPMLQE